MNEKEANPAPLGLLGFGMTTILLNVVLNLLLGQLDGMIMGMGIFYGGLAQVIAGVLEYRKGNTFGMVAFTSYGFFWLSFVALNLLNYLTQQSMAAYFFMWGLFTFFMFFGTLKKNRAIQMVFGSLTILFFLLAAKSTILASTSLTAADLELFTRLIGIEGIICGFSAFYLAMAEVLNAEQGRTVLPIGPMNPS